MIIHPNPTINNGWSKLSMKLRHGWANTVYPKKYAHGFCFAVLCCGYTLTDFPISIRLTSLALWQSNDCPSASKATLINMDKYFMWIHYERLHNHNKAKHKETVCIFLGIYCTPILELKFQTGRQYARAQECAGVTAALQSSINTRSLIPNTEALRTSVSADNRGPNNISYKRILCWQRQHLPFLLQCITCCYLMARIFHICFYKS